MRSLSIIAVWVLFATPAFAQHDPTMHHASPYAGMQQRDIKALSDKEIADLRAGRGMGLAQAAELNGYPGPLHVLELDKQLQLTPDQRARTQALYEEMQRAAASLGSRVIERERDIDALFVRRAATRASLSSAVAEAAQAHGELRALHLSYHLAMLEVLTPAQVARYNALRGYVE